MNLVSGGLLKYRSISLYSRDENISIESDLEVMWGYVESTQDEQSTFRVDIDLWLKILKARRIPRERMIRFESEGFKQESDSCDAQGDISFSEIFSEGGRGHKMRLPGSQRLPNPLLGSFKPKQYNIAIKRLTWIDNKQFKFERDGGFMTEAQARKKAEAESKKLLKGDEYDLGAIMRFQKFCKHERHWMVEVMGIVANASKGGSKK